MPQQQPHPHPATVPSMLEAMPPRPAVEFQPRHGLHNVLGTLQAGGEVRIAYFGGSITAAPGWRVKTLAWFRSRYPRATISEINAGIGGTGSDLGVFRFAHDVLSRKPDLIFVEFAANDAAALPERIRQCMEGIVRQAWKASPGTDLCFVYTVTGDVLKDLQAGVFQRSASAMEQIADHYGIPSIHLGVEVAAREKAGSLVFKAVKPAIGQSATPAGTIVFSEDDVHPTDAGHELYAQVVARSLATLSGGPVVPHVLKPAFCPTNFAQAKLLPLDAVALTDGWTKLDPAIDTQARAFGERVSSLHVARVPGTELAFSFTGTALGIYDLLGPDCGQVHVAIDGQPARLVPRFDGYCTYHRLATLAVAADLPAGRHRVVLTLAAARIDKEQALFEHNRADLRQNPQKYAGAAWYVGGIMLLGELCP